MPTNFSTQNHRHLRRFYLTAGLVLLALGLVLPAAAQAKTVTADVVILDHVLVFNRLGAQNLNAVIFALERDLVDADLKPCGNGCTAGNTILRPDKRPRPLVLRVSAGDTLVVNFKNLLTSAANPDPPLPLEANPVLGDLNEPNNQVAGRQAGFHVQGLQLDTSMADDGSFVGENVSSLAAPAGGTKTYTYFAEKEGAFLVTSMGATFGGEATGGNVGVGAFGAVIVEPPGAKYYRSQLTEEEMRLAATNLDPTSATCGAISTTADGHPIIDYEALYPAVNCNGTVSGETGVDLGATVWKAEGKAGLPILNMLGAGNTLVHADINAVIAGPNTDGSFDGYGPGSTYPQYNPAYPNRLEAFREFVTIFHDETAAANAFHGYFSDPVLGHTLHGVRDSFMINYGSGGIGSEIVANRLGVGPMWDCLDCAYEEFFLTSFTVGDPAMLVDVPANFGLEGLAPGAAPNPLDLGPKATRAFYPADPANVHHNYTGDFVKVRNLHAGPKEQHIFHMHNHQWLFNPNDDNSNYIDAQGVGPGSGYTYELVNGGSGNRNKTSGDVIYHCHFYPHFAQGMWALMRNHDVTETGTLLQVSGAPAGFHDTAWELKDGTPAHNGEVDLSGFAKLGFETTTRALPDGEITVGTPIPAVVPLPGKPMAPMPAPVTVVVKNTNPGVDDNPSTPLTVEQFPESSQANVARVDDVPDSAECAENPAFDETCGIQPKNPGFPFWVAGVDCGGAAGLADATGCRDGIVGQRPTTPPLDMATDSDAAALAASNDTLWDHPGFVTAGGGFDGGLPRHALEGFKAAENIDPITGLPVPGRADPAVVEQHQTRLDFRKVIHTAKPVYFPEQGTDLEQAAMRYHAQKHHDTFLPSGTAARNTSGFRTNGALPVPGAPYQEPCIDDDGDLFTGAGDFFGGNNIKFRYSGATKTATSPRVYKGVNIQIDAVFNKVGYHFPQQRMISLWEDVAAFEDGTKPPEPFVIRMNTFDCTQYYHSNLVPNEYELDDYQVRTPTDIIGQHIHLPKWDLTSADGAANGWNYEDGTLSPGMVEERIIAINHFNADTTKPDVATLPKPDGTGGGQISLEAAPHPFFGEPGGRVTLQRWFSDPVVNNDNEDRGLGIIFTHDHYGPSTHQQIGLYGTVLTEPAGSIWKHNETGVALGSRPDGGPTSWQATISGFKAEEPGRPASADPFREFYLEFSDFQHAYEAGAAGIMPGAIADAGMFRNAINPSFRQEAGPVLPDIVRFPPDCPGGVPRPCPEAISADDVGMLVVNYRNEPVGLRVFDPDKLGPDGKPGTQADGLGGDLAFALQSRIDRAIAAMNQNDLPGAGVLAGDLDIYEPPLNAGGVLPGDPFTPMMRVYPGDLVRVKIQAGGHEHEHNASIHGIKWLQGGSGHGASPTSGWRNAQNDGISEQFTFTSPVNADVQRVTGPADYAYSVDASQDGWWSGMWGIMRNYDAQQPDLAALPGGFTKAPRVINDDEFAGVCPAEEPNNNPSRRVPANRRPYTVIAMTANELLPNPGTGVTIPANNNPTDNVGGPLNPNGGSLVYNPRVETAAFQGPLHDPTALLYVNADDLEPVPGQAKNVCRDNKNRPGVANPACRVQLKAGVKPEPLVLRAAAGECVEVTVFNRLPAVVPDLAGYNTLLQMVLRDRNDLQGVTTFNNNLIRPSSNVGLHPQLVEYDVTKHDGALVGVNPGGPDTGINIVGPVKPDGTLSKAVTYRWYAGHLDFVPEGNGVRIVATPVEFGGVNLQPADKIKQGQKAMVGALIIEPDSSEWVEDGFQDVDGNGVPDCNEDPAIDCSRASATVNGNIRDFAVVFQKGLNHRYGDGTPVENIAGEGGVIPEDSHDAGQAAINYGTEPAWFRFGLSANADFGNAGDNSLGGRADADLLYSNSLAGGDPATPVFTATPGQEARMHVLMPTGVGRGSTFDLHGHLWQRDPYIAGTVPSQIIGDNSNGLYLGHQESVAPSAHFDVVLPSAGGANSVEGDYLYRDHGSFGNTDGLWGILRVDDPETP